MIVATTYQENIFSKLGIFPLLVNCVSPLTTLQWYQKNFAFVQCTLWQQMTKPSLESTLADRLRAANVGDEKSYNAFLEGVTPVIRAVVMRKLFGNTQNDVEDMVQDILLAIHTKRHTWDVVQPVLPWIYAITRYRVIDYLRKRGRTIAQDMQIDDVDETQLIIEQHNSDYIDLPKHVAKLRGRLHMVANAMGLQGKSIQETSRECGISENAVRIAFHRALAQLRKGL